MSDSVAVVEGAPDRRRSTREQSFLLELDSGLASTIELAPRLQSLTSLVVPRLADWCVIASREENHVVWIAASHVEPGIHHELLQRLGKRAALEPSASSGLHKTLLTKQSELVSRISTEWLESAVGDPSHTVSAHTLMVVPLFAHGRMVAAMSLARSPNPAPYTRSDVRFAEEVAKHAALFIDNARLYQAQQDAVKMRDEVLSIVAHDLRNPLNTILMASQVIPVISNPVDVRVQRQLDIIGRSVKRMNRLIEDLLDLARTDSGRVLALQPEDMDLSELLTEIRETFEPRARKKGLTLECEFCGGDVMIRADRTRVFQMLGNLVGNALKFTTAGCVRVRIDRNQAEAVFSVADTGPGINENDLPHLFDRFWQVTRTQRGGAGLGLPIVKKLVEAHGGSLTVESNAGNGSMFRFALPLQPPE